MKNIPSLPYKGSKRKLASRIVDIFPKARTFYDLFAGGGAVTSAALMSGKFERYVMNDIIPGLTDFYRDAVAGRYRDRTEWVSREEFMAKCRTDMFIGLLWSFGNDARSYLYGRDIEDYKRAAHEAVVNEDYSRLHALGIDCPPLVGDTLRERRLAWRRFAPK